MQDMNAEDMSGKLEDMMSTIRQVNEQFKNPVCASFLFSLDVFIFSVVPRSLVSLKNTTSASLCACSRKAPDIFSLIIANLVFSTS